MSDILIGYQEAIERWNKSHPVDQKSTDVDDFLLYLYTNGFTDGIEDYKLRMDNGKSSSK